MDIDELITSLTNDVNNDIFMLQIIFNRHINNIETLKREGFSYKIIMILLNKKINKKINESHFRNLIFRAKQKNKTNSRLEVKTEIKQVLQVEKTEDEIRVSSFDSGELKQSLKEWRLETNIDIPERLALRLESNGIDTEKLNELGLTTTSKISKYLTQIEHKKSW